MSVIQMFNVYLVSKERWGKIWTRTRSLGDLIKTHAPFVWINDGTGSSPARAIVRMQARFEGLLPPVYAFSKIVTGLYPLLLVLRHTNKVCPYHWRYILSIFKQESLFDMLNMLVLLPKTALPPAGPKTSNKKLPCPRVMPSRVLSAVKVQSTG